MKTYDQFLKIPDYIYSCINLDSDEQKILSVIISYESNNKALYMCKETFSEILLLAFNIFSH